MVIRPVFEKETKHILGPDYLLVEKETKPNIFQNLAICLLKRNRTKLNLDPNYLLVKKETKPYIF